MPKFLTKKKGESLDKLVTITVLPETIPDGNLVAADGTGDGKDSGFSVNRINDLIEEAATSTSNITKIVNGTTKVGKAGTADKVANSLSINSSDGTKTFNGTSAVSTPTLATETFVTTNIDVVKEDIQKIIDGDTIVDKATKDALGQIITTTYATKTELATEVNKVKNGTTVAGNSAKLGNKPAEDYAIKTEVAQQISTNLTQANTYTDEKIAALVDTAPDTLNTLSELAEAILEHQDLTDKLDEAIHTKADGIDGIAIDSSKLGGQNPDYYATAQNIEDIKDGLIIVGKAVFADKATQADNATKAEQDNIGNIITTTYATKEELQQTNDNITNIVGGNTIVPKAEEADKAVNDINGNAITNTYATIVELNKTTEKVDGLLEGTKKAAEAEQANLAIKAIQDNNGNVITDTYATKTSVNNIIDGTTKVTSSINSENSEKAAKVNNIFTIKDVDKTYIFDGSQQVYIDVVGKAEAKNLFIGTEEELNALSSERKALIEFFINTEEDHTSYEAYATQNALNNVINGTTPVTQAINADYATKAERIIINSGSSDLERKIVVTNESDSGQNLYYVNDITANYATGTLTAKKFKGSLIGNADTATKATKATQDASGNTITSTYATKNELNTAKAEINTQITSKINELIDAAPETMDTLKEVSDAIAAHQTVTDALNAAIGNKADGTNGVANNANKLNGQLASYYAKATDLTSHTSNKSNPHEVSLSQLGVTATAAELNVLDGITATTAELNYMDGVTSNVQTQLNGKAASSHGTHVSYGTSAPAANGTASAGSASTVSRSDHVHPLQTTVSGNAGTATKLATARTITLTGSVTGSGSFDGSGDLSIATTTNHTHSYLPLSGGTVTGATVFSNTTASSSTTTGAVKVSGGLGVAGNIYGAKVYGAVYNDYAEYRNQIEPIKPGYCVASFNNGQVYKTTEKFQACDGIVSDTFGFAIGETDECKTPLAVAGRVLAYCEGDRNNYHSGDTVCAGPDGKVCKMTREEIREWPDRIVGIVSEIPQYETWGTGNVEVDNRIWIKIR